MCKIIPDNLENDYSVSIHTGIDAKLLDNTKTVNFPTVNLCRIIKCVVL